MSKIAVIGSGIAGSVCAWALSTKGYSVTLFDKSRGVSGRSTSKRWDSIAIDMGVPYITNQEWETLHPKIKKTIQDCIEPWACKSNTNSTISTKKVYVAKPKMSRIARALTNGIALQSQQRIIGVEKKSDTWSLASESEQVFDGFHGLVIAVPCMQIPDIHGLPLGVYKAAKNVQAKAINTLLIETDSPLFDLDEYCFSDHPTIQRVIADYKKPYRDSNRFTYAVHSNMDWATDTFDSLSKEAVETEIRKALEQLWPISGTNILTTLMHRWKYAQVVDPILPFCQTEAQDIVCCGDWCSGPSFVDAMNSGVVAAEAMFVT